MPCFALDFITFNDDETKIGRIYRLSKCLDNDDSSTTHSEQQHAPSIKLDRRFSAIDSVTEIDVDSTLLASDLVTYRDYPFSPVNNLIVNFESDSDEPFSLEYIPLELRCCRFLAVHNRKLFGDQSRDVTVLDGLLDFNGRIHKDLPLETNLSRIENLQLQVSYADIKQLKKLRTLSCLSSLTIHIDDIVDDRSIAHIEETMLVIKNSWLPDHIILDTLNILIDVKNTILDTMSIPINRIENLTVLNNSTCTMPVIRFVGVNPMIKRLEMKKVKLSSTTILENEISLQNIAYLLETSHLINVYGVKQLDFPNCMKLWTVHIENSDLRDVHFINCPALYYLTLINTDIDSFDGTGVENLDRLKITLPRRSKIIGINETRCTVQRLHQI
jgi:hypothetical protein